MSEEDLLIGDDAIRGEEAYCFSDDVVGVVSSADARHRAMERMSADMEEHAILEGRDLESGNRNSALWSEHAKHGNAQEIKIE